MARLVLVDDHRMVVEAFRALLERDHRIVGVANNGKDLLELLRHNEADCVLLDLSMPGTNGLELIPAILRLQSSCRILIVSMLVDRPLVEATIRSGARGWIPKDAPTEELRTAISEVLDGRLYVSPRIPKCTHGVGLKASHTGLERLTPRQQQIVLLLGQGKSGAEISSELGLSPSTITFHKHNIMRILGIESEARMHCFAVLVCAAVANQKA